MNEKEHLVRQREHDVRRAESQLREAQRDMQYGYAKAKAEFDKECDRLKEEVNRATIRLDSEKDWLRLAKADLERFT